MFVCLRDQNIFGSLQAKAELLLPSHKQLCLHSFLTSSLRVLCSLLAELAMDILDAISISSSSGQSSSSPRDSPSRSSTPSQSSTSSDFLSSDGTPPWTYSNHATVSLLDEDNRKPSLDPYYSLGMSNTSHALQTTPPRGILLEDLMQEDVYEYAS